MKKFFVSVIAIATLGMVMTSCKKDESVSKEDIHFTFCDNAVMNDLKTRIVYNEGMNQFDLFWTNGDQVCIGDNGRITNVALYRVTPIGDGREGTMTYVRDWVGAFSALNTPLTCWYPTSIYATKDHVKLPATQVANSNGMVSGYPLYAKGDDITNMQFQNITGLVVFTLDGDVAIDSIAITTDKYINGYFKVANNFEISYQNGGYSVQAHGTKTNTLTFNNSFQLTSEGQEVMMYLPAGTYNRFDVTFFVGDQKYVRRYTTAQTIVRSEFNRYDISVTSSKLKANNAGELNGLYNVGSSTPVYVKFAQGNLEYVPMTSLQYWHFADNQWDYRGRYQYLGGEGIDRDLFAWGANGYYVRGHNAGNNVKVFAVSNEYNYYTGTDLNNTNAWGNNNIVNGGAGWRCLTAEEATNLISNHTPHKATSYNGKVGYVLYPVNYTGTVHEDNHIFTANEWAVFERDGGLFLAIENHREATGNLKDRITTGTTSSYFWLNTAADANTASALVVSNTGVSVENNINKRCGAFVRLVKDAVVE